MSERTLVDAFASHLNRNKKRVYREVLMGEQRADIVAIPDRPTATIQDAQAYEAKLTDWWGALQQAVGYSRICPAWVVMGCEVPSVTPFVDAGVGLIVWREWPTLRGSVYRENIYQGRRRQFVTLARPSGGPFTGVGLAGVFRRAIRRQIPEYAF